MCSAPDLAVETRIPATGTESAAISKPGVYYLSLRTERSRMSGHAWRSPGILRLRYLRFFCEHDWRAFFMSDPITAPTTEKPSTNLVRRPRFLPPIGSRGYHLLLGAVAILILGPLGGITATFMNFSVGFFVGGQVLAGILGSAVTFGYGSEGKHGANYIQTMAASVVGMCGMAVLGQGTGWLWVPQPPALQPVLYV